MDKYLPVLLTRIPHNDDVLLWLRKAGCSGLNRSDLRIFVTIFTQGTLGTLVSLIVRCIVGAISQTFSHLGQPRADPATRPP